MKRLVYRVQWLKSRGLWRVTLPSKTLRFHYDKQHPTILAAVTFARDDWQRGYPAQVVLHGKNGRIRWERTYGRDPKRTKG